jgi:hypothetical protein
MLDYMLSGVCSVVKSVVLKMQVLWGVMLYCWIRVSDVSAVLVLAARVKQPKKNVSP